MVHLLAKENHPYRRDGPTGTEGQVPGSSVLIAPILFRWRLLTHDPFSHSFTEGTKLTKTSSILLILLITTPNVGTMIAPGAMVNSEPGNFLRVEGHLDYAAGRFSLASRDSLRTVGYGQVFQASKCATRQDVKACLAEGVDPSAPRMHGGLPIHKAAEYVRLPGIIAELIDGEPLSHRSSGFLEASSEVVRRTDRCGSRSESAERTRGESDQLGRQQPQQTYPVCRWRDAETG